MSARHPTEHRRVGDQALEFSRVFDAPAHLVFRAHVDAGLFARWMGPAGSTLHLGHFDARTGGSFRYRVGADDAFTFFGSYHQVASPTRIVHTWEMLGGPGRPTLETLTFTDLANGQSQLAGLSLFTSVEHCTATLEWDLTGNGMDENFARLDDLLA